MRILMASTSYPANPTDWKGLFIRHLAEALAKRQDVQLSLWAPPGDTGPRIAYAASAAEANFLAGLASQGGIAHLLRTRRVAGAATSLRLLAHLRRAYRRADADAYHINWLQNAIALPDDGRPALVSVLGTDMRLARSPLVRAALRRVFRRRKTAICPNADWMKTDLESWFGDVARIVPVPFGIDAMWFEAGRDEFLAPADWLVVSRLTEDKIGTLFDWAQPWFAGHGRRLNLIGPAQDSIPLPAWVRYHGPATPKELAESWFPRARGIISLSRHAEGRPQVMLEAMAAGLPVIASRLPAHEDLLRNGETGYLVGSTEELGHRLHALEAEDHNREIGNAARSDVRIRIGSWDDCAERYIAIHRELGMAR